MISETPDFPKEYLPLASAMARALARDVRWTFISPAAEFEADGERKGNIIVSGEVFTLNRKGKSVISYLDYAIGLVDEIEQGNHIQECI